MFVMEPLKSMEAVLPDAATPGLELVCPAGSLPALKAAVDHGANCVYLGLRDATNARNFAGLNFDEDDIAKGIAYAHGRGCKVFMALNTYPQAANPGPWRSALDKAVDLGVDAVILADPGLMQYALPHHPRRVCPAEGRALGGDPAGPRVAPERRAHRPLRARRERGLPHAVQGPLRRGG